MQKQIDKRLDALEGAKRQGASHFLVLENGVYRDKDGLEMNESEYQKWLKKQNEKQNEIQVIFVVERGDENV